jgi:hypothetical protein
MNVCVGKPEAEVCGDKLHHLQVLEIKILDAIMKMDAALKCQFISSVLHMQQGMFPKATPLIVWLAAL